MEPQDIPAPAAVLPEEVPEAARRPAPEGTSPVACPIVGIGASAGGLEALRSLFARVPADTGLAFVVIQHLDPDGPSLLASVLRGLTPIPVVEVTNGMRVEPNRLHVIPAGSDLTIERGVLGLVPRSKARELHLPIDAFFRALASDQTHCAIGVVLSGSGSDGAKGLRAIKNEGGITIVQSPDSAQFRSMPEAALADGGSDFCGTPEEIARELFRLSHHPYLAQPHGPGSEGGTEDKDLAFVLAALRKQVGVDFSGYKATSVRRRIQRRMAVHRASTLGEYADALRGSPDEARLLAEEILIHVTSFFRDPEAFEALKLNVCQRLVREKEADSSIRVWVPGCSTGEEVYSIAICLAECMGDKATGLTVKLFGSDLSEGVIDVARAGLYSESSCAGVSPERLARFFEPTDGGYRVTQRIRDLCVFVKHDLTRDPPFAKLDLISCRNLLIYFDADLQRRVIPMLHSCLVASGTLFLGQSEALVDSPDLFSPYDRERRIFTRTGESRPMTYPLVPGGQAKAATSRSAPPDRQPPVREALKQADQLLLARFAPAGVVVNERLEIVQFRGRTGAFLESPPGQPEVNLLRMARPDLVASLHELLGRAKNQLATVRRERVRLAGDAGPRLVDLEVVPLVHEKDSRERFYLILFQEAGGHARPPPEPDVVGRGASIPGEDPELLKAELSTTKDYLQWLISEHQSRSDELAATNEELIAANEELQSTNEELLSAKEELQSTNEELHTLNEQLRGRNEDLDKAVNDLANVLSSVEIPIIIVDLELKVRRFTPRVQDIASFIPADLGRPIEDLRLKMRVDDLGARIREVLQANAPREWEVHGQDGRWFRMQIHPYLTTDHRLDGAVISFVDVDVLKHALRDAEDARDSAKGIVEAISTPLVVLDSELHVVSANEAFHQLFALARGAADGRSLFDLDRAAWDVPAVRKALSGSPVRFDGLELTSEFLYVGRRTVSLTARPIRWGIDAPMTLLAVDDLAHLRGLEAEAAQLLQSETRARFEAERANRAKDLFLATLSHELRTPLSAMLMHAQLLQRMAFIDPRVVRSISAIERSAMNQSKLIDDLLDVSRIVAGKLVLDLRAVDLADVIRDAVDLARPALEAKGLILQTMVDDKPGLVYGDTERLQQVVSNLLANAVKFTPRGGKITARLDRSDGRARIEISDTGIGIPPEVMPHVFARFVQADSSVTRSYGGLGLGLAIVRHLVEAHGGEVQAESAGDGKGATFIVTLPLGVGLARVLRGAPATAASPRINGVRVLLVEDNDDAREAFSAMLTELGAEVRTAPSAATGLAVLDEWLPQVILSDIAMPGEDGYSFIGKVRQRRPERGGQIPAAALTALAGDDDGRQAMAVGFQMHLTKPLDSSRLAAALDTLAHWKS